MSRDFSKLYAPNGVFSFQKMFWEYGTPATRKQYPPMFTLKPVEHKGLPSAYQIYMDSIDEYDAATKLTPNMRVWDVLKEAKWFKNGDVQHAHDGLETWREHMKQRDASLAKNILIEQTREGNTTAARALLAESKVKLSSGRKNNKVVKPGVNPRVVAFKQKMKG